MDGTPMAGPQRGIATHHQLQGTPAASGFVEEDKLFDGLVAKRKAPGYFLRISYVFLMHFLWLNSFRTY